MLVGQTAMVGRQVCWSGQTAVVGRQVCWSGQTAMVGRQVCWLGQTAVVGRQYVSRSNSYGRKAGMLVGSNSCGR